MARWCVCQSPELLFFTQSAFYRGEPRWNSLHGPLFPPLWWPTTTQTGSQGELWHVGAVYSLLIWSKPMYTHTLFSVCGPLNLLWPLLEHWGCTHTPGSCFSVRIKELCWKWIAFTECDVHYCDVLNDPKHMAAKQMVSGLVSNIALHILRCR